jgi:bifunctional DNase/RNase
VDDVRAVPVFETVDSHDVHSPPTPGERRVVLLAEKQGERVLPIWIGDFESDAMLAACLGEAGGGDFGDAL